MATKKSSINTKQQGHLSIQVDACADHLSKLIGVIREQKNQALISGDLDAADRFDTLSLKYTDQYSVVLRHQLQTIDSSAEMKQAIKGFADVNKRIKDASKEIKSLTEFANTLTAIAGMLDKLITRFLIEA